MTFWFQGLGRHAEAELLGAARDQSCRRRIVLSSFAVLAALEEVRALVPKVTTWRMAEHLLRRVLGTALFDSTVCVTRYTVIHHRPMLVRSTPPSTCVTRGLMSARMSTQNSFSHGRARICRHVWCNGRLEFAGAFRDFRESDCTLSGERAPCRDVTKQRREDDKRRSRHLLKLRRGGAHGRETHSNDSPRLFLCSVLK